MSDKCQINIIPYRRTTDFGLADFDWAYEVISPSGNKIHGACRGSYSAAEKEAHKMEQKLMEYSYVKGSKKKRFRTKTEHAQSILKNNPETTHYDIRIMVGVSDSIIRQWENAGHITFTTNKKSAAF